MTRPPTLPALPFELLAERAGLKPVVFLSVPPEREAALRASLDPALHVERGERVVRIAAGDRWGAGGERRFVELFLSRDPDLARGAKALQDADPTRNARALGELLGYPRCCVEAFALQPDRRDNSRNRTLTAARTRGAMPWPWELSNVDRMIVPFFPCAYDCAAALSLARAVIAEAERAEAGIAAATRRELRGAIVYADADRWLALEGEPLSGTRVRIERMRPSPSLARAREREGDALQAIERKLSDAVELDAAALAGDGDVHAWIFG